MPSFLSPKRFSLLGCLALLVTSLAGAVTTAFAQPVLLVEKTASVPVVQPGDALIYQITVTNTGDQAAIGLELEDTLSPLLAFESATGGGTIGAQAAIGAVVRWSLPLLAPGQTGSVLVNSRVQTTTPGTDITNTARLRSLETGDILSNTVSTRVDSGPNLFIGKAASRESAENGDEIVYTLNVSNFGGLATNLVLTDVLAEGLSFASASNGGRYDSATRTVRWELAALDRGQSGAVTLSVLVAGAADGAVLENQAVLDSDETESLASNTVSVKISSRADIEVDVSASGSNIVPGDLLQFTTSVRNSSPNAAEALRVEADVPVNTQYVSNLGGGVLNGSRLVWDLGDLPPLQTATVVMTVRVDAPLPDDTQIEFEATADIANGISDGAGVLVNLFPAPRFLLHVEAPTQFVSPGEVLTYTVDYENGGNRAEDTMLRVYLPPSSSLLSATSGATPEGGALRWSLGAFPSGASGSRRVTVKFDRAIENGAVLTTLATIEASTGFPVSDRFRVQASSLPVLTLTKTAEAPIVAPGERFSYLLRARNIGASSATQVRITDSLPDQTRFIEASDGGQETAPGSGIVTWPTVNLPPGGLRLVLVTVQVDATVPSGTVLHNAASITSDQTPPAQAPIVDTLVASLPNLRLQKKAARPVVQSGSELDYLLRYGNDGSDQATDVKISDQLPPELEFVSATSGGIFEPQSRTVRWMLGTLPARASGELTVRTRVAATVSDGAVIDNVASVLGAGAAPQLAAATVRVAARPQPAVGIPGLQHAVRFLLVGLLLGLGWLRFARP
ncbi:MAG: DUF11 domain-containing protein [Xanthomonadales bacterium]|nr:DUF11 domain-containing protein [Xanthomonadales bacterium]